MLERKFFHQNYSEAEIDKYMDRYRTLGTTLIDYVLPSTEIKGGEVFIDSDGTEYGKGLGKILTNQSDKLKKKIPKPQ